MESRCGKNLPFFCWAGNSVPDELFLRPSDLVFAEGRGVSELIAQHPDDRRWYNDG